MTEMHRTPLPANNYRPLGLGWDAQREGKYMLDNPYPTTNWKHYDWDRGWLMAEEAGESEQIIVNSKSNKMKFELKNNL